MAKQKRQVFSDSERKLIHDLKELGKPWVEIADVMTAKKGVQTSVESCRWQFNRYKIELEAAPLPAAEKRRQAVAESNTADGRKIVSVNRPSFTGKANELSGVCYVERKPIGIAEALANYDVDPDVWRVKFWECGEWNGQAKVKQDGEEIMTITDLFRIRIVFERVVGAESLKKILSGICEKASAKAKKWDRPKLPTPPAGGLLTLNVPDLHLGKLAWPPETESDAYDMKIATETFVTAVQDLVEKAVTAGWEFDRVLLPIGNDFLNSDSFVGGKAGASSKGTLQDEDGRWQKSFMTGFELVEEVIDWITLETAKPVDVVIVPGNHDTERIFYLGHSIDIAFRNHENVTVDNRPVSRKYYAHGKTLIGLTHGDKEKADTLPLLMAGKNDLTAYTCKEWYLGHLHHRRRRSYETESETGPCILRWFASLSPPDSWHAAQGYEMSARCAEAFFYGVNGHLGGMVAHFPET